MKNLTQAWNQLTDFNQSPILNGTKATAFAVQSKAGKATVAATIVTASTALSTGIVPVNVKVAQHELTNTEVAEARAIYPGFGACGSYQGYQPGCAYVVSWLPWNTIWRSQEHRNWRCWNQHKGNPKIRNVFSARIKGWPACVTQFNPNDDYAQESSVEVIAAK